MRAKPVSGNGADNLPAETAVWPFRSEGGRILLDIKVTPGASHTETLDVREGRLRVKIAAAPEDGKANAALTAFFAKLLGLPKKNVSLIRGEKSRLKTVAFQGRTP
jgi:uncharacterized protein (TIGR00251 family)